MQNHRAPFNAIDSYLNQNRVNYVGMISRPPIQQARQLPPDNSGNNDNHDTHTRRTNVFTPPGANWISRKKSVASSPAPNRMLPQPQSMNNVPYQATIAMLPTTAPMHNNNSIRLPTTTSVTNTNNSMTAPHPLHSSGYSNEGRKQAVDQSLESFQFPSLSAHLSSSSSFHEDNTDREHWRHSEENSVQHVGRHETSSSSHHILSGDDKNYLDRRDNFIPTDIPNNNHSQSNNNNLIDNNNWWKRQDSIQHQNQEQQEQQPQPQYHQQNRQQHQNSSISFRNDYEETLNNTEQISNSKQADRPKKKRSKNAFFIFSEERREQLRAQQPRIRNSDLNKLLGKEWKELSEENKSHYKHRAEILKEHDKQYSEQQEQQYSSSNGHHNSNDHDIMRSLLISSSSPSSSSSPPLPYYSNSPIRRNNHYQHYHPEHPVSPRQLTANDHDDYSTSHQHNESRNNTIFATPRHLSIGSERSHDALFVSANNTDWHSPSNSGSKNDEDDEDDNTVQVGYEENNEVIEDIPTSDESSPSSPLNGTATTSNNSRNVVSVASHSGAAEAEALAGLAASMQRNDALKRLAYKRHGEKPKRVKRPPNAYLLFNRDVRHKILDGNPNLTVSEISKEISERWNALSEESKAYYNQEAARLKQRHMDDNPNFIYTRRSKAELEEAGYRSRPSKRRRTDDPITTTAAAATTDDPGQQHSQNNSNHKQNGVVKERDPRGRKKKRLKNPTAPKHPMSGFLFYSISIRSQIVEHMPKATVGEISKVIAERWRKLDEKTRSPYIQQAKEDKERYAREMESFTATMLEGLDEAMADGSNGNHHHHHHHHHHHRQGNMSPVELDSHTIATVAQMVNPRGEHLLPPLSSSSSPRQYQVLPATPRNDD